MGQRVFLASLVCVGLVVLLSVSPAAAYYVRPGDTLSGISKRTGTPVGKIASLNHLADPNRIYPGEQLTLSGDESPLAPGTIYTVRAGDSLWKISRSVGVSVNRLVQMNEISNPALIVVGERLVLSPAAVLPAAPSPTPAAAPAPAPAPVSAGTGQPVHGAAARQLLRAAALEFGVNPALVLAIALWESGYNQGLTSPAGALGLMQIEPATADWAGPALLGGKVDIQDARSNARLGAALIRHYLDEFNDPKLALAAYYQGPTATHLHGIFPASNTYVDGIWSLRNSLMTTP